MTPSNLDLVPQLVACVDVYFIDFYYNIKRLVVMSLMQWIFITPHLRLTVFSTPSIFYFSDVVTSFDL